MKHFTVEVYNCGMCPHLDYSQSEELCSLVEGTAEEAVEVCNQNSYELTDSCPRFKNG